MRVVAVCAGVLVVTGLSAQSRPTSQPPHAAAIRAWLASGDDPELLDEAVAAVLAGGEPACRTLGRIVTTLTTEHPRRAAAELLLRDIALGYLESVSESDLRFAGQFAPLAPLQPWVGRIYLQLVISTPDWFPEDLRTSVVPALRDLFPKGPGDDAQEQLHAIATDTEIQPAALRHALACAFAQWGNRTLIAPRLAELREGAGDRTSVDELYFVRALAELRYELREYEGAADEWTAYLRGAEDAGAVPRPIEYYNAACALALAGRVDDSLGALERCAARLRAADLDESQRLERSLFDEDPELALVRPLPRFRALVESAFGAEGR